MLGFEVQARCGWLRVGGSEAPSHVLLPVSRVAVWFVRVLGQYGVAATGSLNRRGDTRVAQGLLGSFASAK